MKKLLLVSIILLLSINMCSCSEDKTMNDSVKEEEFPIEKFVGHWTSELPSLNKKYDEIPISAKIKKNKEGEYTGEFFFTTVFVTCCNSGINDGVINFKVSNGNVTKFIYNDKIKNCNGTFEGTGTFDNKELIIDFDGNDCEGKHEKGKLVLRK